MNEDEIAIEFFTKGVWLSEEGFEGLGGEWKIQKDKIIMEDLYGNIFEGFFRQDEKGEYIILDGEAYYRESLPNNYNNVKFVDNNTSPLYN